MADIYPASEKHATGNPLRYRTSSAAFTDKSARTRCCSVEQGGEEVAGSQIIGGVIA